MCLQFYQLLKTLLKNSIQSFKNFLWKGPDKIARQSVINDCKYGGLNLIDIETSIKASRLTWIGKLFSEGSLPWKAYKNQLLKDFGGKCFIQMQL